MAATATRASRSGSGSHASAAANGWNVVDDDDDDDNDNDNDIDRNDGGGASGSSTRSDPERPSFPHHAVNVDRVELVDVRAEASDEDTVSNSGALVSLIVHVYG